MSRLCKQLYALDLNEWFDLTEISHSHSITLPSHFPMLKKEALPTNHIHIQHMTICSTIWAYRKH